MGDEIAKRLTLRLVPGNHSGRMANFVLAVHAAGVLIGACPLVLLHRHDIGVYRYVQHLACVTTKKLHMRSVIRELLWFLRGDTNVAYLQKNGVSIWDEWADEDGELEQMALTPCHCLFQFFVADGRLSCQLYQRSSDIGLGVPFNIASYSLLTTMMAQVCELKPGEFVWTGGDAHIYLNHVDALQEQLTREPREQPRMAIADRGRTSSTFATTTSSCCSTTPIRPSRWKLPSEPPSETAVAVQGELGSFSELAAFEFFSPDVPILPCVTFADLFDAVGRGQAACGMAPVENSLAGSIDPVWDLLVERGPSIVGELSLHIEHCLIGHPDTTLEDVRRIYSHQQALAQCQEFICGLDQVDEEEFYDTAGAVKMIKDRGKPEEAAIASAQAAIDYEMQILAEKIQTNHQSFTRFLVISGKPADFADAALKSTLVLKADLSTTSVVEICQVVSRNRITASKLEMRKCLGKPWLYLIYLDLEGGMGGSARDALKELESLTEEVHVVGSYPAGSRSEARLHRQ